MAGIHYRLDWQVLDSYFQFAELSSAPATPEANSIRQYAIDSSGVSTICWKNDGGAAICLPTAAGTLTVGGGTGVTGAVAFWTSSTALGLDDNHFHWDDTNDQLLIGINTGSHLATDSGLCLDEDGSSSIIGSAAHSATAAHSGAVNLLRSRGTHASQSIVAVDDRIMRVVAQAYDGSLYRDAASIDAYVDATPGSGDMPGRLVFNTTPDGSTTLTKAMAIHSTGFVGLGSTTFTPAFKLEMRGAVNADVNIVIGEASADTTSPGLNLLKARGTLASPAATAADDPLGNISWGGWTTTEKFNAARIQVNAGSLWSGSNSETYMFFQTTPSASLTRAERFRIGSAGQWGIGGATFGTAGQVFTSGGASAAPSWTTIASGAHTILDATNHTDSVTQTVSRGSLIYGNSTPKWDELVVGGANTFLRTDGTDAAWSTLTIPNAATSTQIAYASGSNALGFTGDVTYDGTDFALNSGKRFRMQSQNRVRYLNSTVQATRTAAQTGLAVNTFTAIAFNATDLFDTDTLHDTASNNSRLTAAIDGKYAVFGSAYLLNSGSAVVPLSSYLRISINGTLHSETGIPYDGGITGNIIAIADLVVLTAGQYVELLADMVATSGTFDVSASINPTFGMVYVGE